MLPLHVINSQVAEQANASLAMHLPSYTQMHFGSLRVHLQHFVASYNENKAAMAEADIRTLMATSGAVRESDTLRRTLLVRNNRLIFSLEGHLYNTLNHPVHPE